MANTGSASGNALALVFVSDPIMVGLSRYWKHLAGWVRFDVDAGATAQATVMVEVGTLKFSGADMKRQLHPGAYTFSAGLTHMTDDTAAVVQLPPVVPAST